MKQKKMVALLCVCMLEIAMVLGGCGSQNADTASADTTNEQSDDTDTAESDGTATETTEEITIFGEISAIDGDTLTIALAEQPTRGEAPSKEAPTGKAPTGKAPAGEAPTGEMPTEEGSTEMPDGDKPSGDKPGKESSDGIDMKIILTGEEQTITVDEDTVITANGENADSSALSTDEVVNVVLQGEKVISITVGGGRGGEKPAEETTGTEV